MRYERAVVVCLTAVALALAPACGDFGAAKGELPTDAEAGPPSDAADGGAPEVDAATAEPCDHEKPFGMPVIVPFLSAPAEPIITPTLTDDERQMIFSVHEGEAGKFAFRLSYATRPDRAAAFGAPIPLTKLAKGVDERSPALAANGLTLFFQSSAAGGRIEVWTTARSSPGAFTFTDPTLLAAISPPSQTVTGAPHPARTGGALYYTASVDLGVSPLHLRRAVASNGFTGKAIPELDSLLGENGPVPTADETGLYYSRNTAAGAEVWFARRPSASGSYTNIQSVPELSSGTNDIPGWLSADGCRLYFTSNRSGSLSIYYADKPAR